MQWERSMMSTILNEEDDSEGVQNRPGFLTP